MRVCDFQKKEVLISRCAFSLIKKNAFELQMTNLVTVLVTVVCNKIRIRLKMSI